MTLTIFPDNKGARGYHGGTAARYVGLEAERQGNLPGPLGVLAPVLSS